MNRRKMLSRGLAASLGLALPGLLEAHGSQPSDEAIPWSDVPEPLAPGVRPGVKYYDLSKLASRIVSNDDFFVLQHHEIPQLEARSFRLKLQGLVERPSELGLSELERRPKTELEVCFECAGNGRFGMHGLVGNAVWGGLRLEALLKEHGWRPEAREVVFHGADGAVERLRNERYPSRFARSLPLDLALSGDVLLAYEMNGERLPVAHGFPLRLIVPGWYGVAQVKWLERIELVDRPFMGWFMSKDYVTLRGRKVGAQIEYQASSVGRARLKSILTRVSRPGKSAGGPLTLHGVAWGDGTPIEAVEVRIDDGPYRTAELDRGAGPYGWTPFHCNWTDPTAGRHRLTSRAIDRNTRQPTEEEASAYRVTPWENNGQVVREIVLP